MRSDSKFTVSAIDEPIYHAMVEAAPNAMVLVDRSGSIVLVNAQTERMFGAPRAALIGQPIEALVPKRYRGDHRGSRADYLANPQARAMGMGRELFALRQDGTEFPVEIGLNPIETKQGTMVLTAIVDITERKRLEAHFRQVVESTPNGIVMVNSKGLITLVNTQSERMFGASRAELIGQAVEILLPERYRAEHPGARNEFFSTPKARAMGTGRDLYALRRDGTEFPVEIGLNPLETDQGTMVLAAIVDITERKRLQTNFEQVVESVPNGIVMIDRKGLIVLVNAQAEQMFGSPRASLIGLPIETLVPVRYRAEHPESRANFFSSPKARAMGTGRDLYALRQDGTEFPVEIGLNPIETSQGMMVLASIVDTTERKRLEEHFRKVVESTPNGIVMVDSSGRITLVNAQAEQMFEVNRTELIGQPVESLLPERYRAEHIQSRTSFFVMPKVRGMGRGRDLYALKSTGKEFPVEIGLNPIETTLGTMVLASIVDITERKHAEQSLRESEERFRLMVDGVKDYAIFMIDVEGRVKSWNKGAEGVKGYQAEEVLGQPLAIFYTQEDRDAGVPEQHLRIAREQGRYEDEVIRVRKDGTQFWANVVLTTLYDEQGCLQGYAKITRDITERKRSQETMARALEEKTTLLNEVHHRVKNNLQVISSLFNLQAAHIQDESARQVLAESQGRVRAMALIHQLLYESRDFTRINMGDYLNRLGQLLITLHKTTVNSITVKTEIMGDPVYLDLHRAIPCGLLVTELVTNSFKHAFPDKRKGEVFITLVGQGHLQAMLSVHDTGIGLPKDFQLEQGTSLGHRLVLRLAEQIKGRLSIGEVPGASFILHFTPLMEIEEK